MEDLGELIWSPTETYSEYVVLRGIKFLVEFTIKNGSPKPGQLCGVCQERPAAATPLIEITSLQKGEEDWNITGSHAAQVKSYLLEELVPAICSDYEDMELPLGQELDLDPDPEPDLRTDEDMAILDFALRKDCYSIWCRGLAERENLLLG